MRARRLAAFAAFHLRSSSIPPPRAYARALRAQLWQLPAVPRPRVDGVNFVNFVGFRTPEHPGEQPFRHAGGMPAVRLIECGMASPYRRRRFRGSSRAFTYVIANGPWLVIWISLSTLVNA